MRILALGDIVGTETIGYLQKNLWNERRRLRVDAVVANGENTSGIRGLCSADAEALFDTGIDLLTLGNHAFDQRDLYSYLEDNDGRIIRPANYPPGTPGSGYTILDVNGWRVLCINVSGRAMLDPLASPFDTVDRILEREAGRYDVALMDIHAEATSEKLALGRYFDGRIKILFGTHTHVPTADEQILPRGSGYQTDLGMCGPIDSIIGSSVEEVITRFRTMMPTRLTVPSGPLRAQGTVFDLDENGWKLRGVERIVF